MADDAGGDRKGGGDVEGVLEAVEGDPDDGVPFGEGLVGEAVLLIAEHESEGRGEGEVEDRGRVGIGLEGDQGPGEVVEEGILFTYDLVVGPHRGLLHFGVVDEGGRLCEADFAQPEGFYGAQNAADIEGGAEAVEVDGDGEGRDAGGFVGLVQGGREEVVLLPGDAGLPQMVVVPVGEGGKVALIQPGKFRPDLHTAVEREMAGVPLFVEVAQEPRYFFVAHPLR